MALHDRIYNDASPIDVAFIGSSHTICGVSDSMLHVQLRGRGKDIQPANLGYCSFGRNMHYTLVKQLLHNKKSRTIVIEITERENRGGHESYPYFADAADIFTPVLMFDGGIFNDIRLAFIVRFEWLKQKMRGTYSLPSVSGRQYSHEYIAQHASPKDMENARNERVPGWKKAMGFERWFYNQYSFNYLERIAKLCSENNCNMLFLYLPEYASIQEPEEMDFYKQHGQMLIPPTEILADENNWKDVGHMNATGADKMAAWLATQL